MKDISEVHLRFFEEFHNRRNEIDSMCDLIFSSSNISKDSYERNSLLRSGFVMINSHYEGFIKKLFNDYLSYIFNNTNCALDRIFYYNSLEKINNGQVLNNIPLGKLEKLLISLNMSFSEFINLVNKNLFQKNHFKRIIKDYGCYNYFYKFDKNGKFSPKLSLQFILKDFLIEKRNRISHGELLEISEEEYMAIKYFVIMFIGILIEFIIDNIDQSTFIHR